MSSLQAQQMDGTSRTGEPDSSTAPQVLYFEDHVPGSVAEYGSIAVDESEMIEFARKFDPQSFHVDPEKAARGPFQGLIASGVHTLGLMMRLYVDHHLSKVATLGSPGIEELRWIRPVRPGDTLKIRVTILQAKRSRTKPDRGMVVAQTEVLNQNGEVVMTVKALMIMRCREQAE